MPGQRIRLDLMQQILQLKSISISNRSISKTLRLSRNTVNKYLKLYGERRLNEKLQVKVTKSYANKERLEHFCAFLNNKKITEPLNRLKLWSEYRVDTKNGYSYTHFAKLLCLVKQQFNRENSINFPVLITGKVSNGFVDKETGEVKSTKILCLYFPIVKLYFVSRTDQEPDSIIKFLEATFRQLGRLPLHIAVLSYPKSGSKFNSQVIEMVSDWLNLVGIKCMIRDKQSICDDLEDRIKDQLKTVYQLSLISDAGDLIKSNLDEIIELGLTRSMLLKALGSSITCDLPSHFPKPRKKSIVKVQKMSHIYLPEDKHYYSVPAIYIGKIVTAKYNSETVNIYNGDDLVCEHRRNQIPHKYSTFREHLESDNGWTKEYFIKVAARIGPSTKTFVMSLIEQYKFPHVGYKQANAIILLKHRYRVSEIESACKNLLVTRPLTFQRLKREIDTFIALQ
jgi:transposase